MPASGGGADQRSAGDPNATARGGPRKPRSDAETGFADLPLVSPLQEVDGGWIVDAFNSPFVVLSVIGLLAAPAAGLLVVFGVRRFRESWY